jgi:hypothetical protein
MKGAIEDVGERFPPDRHPRESTVANGSSGRR